MQQPPGFVDLTNPSHVCKLRKSLYSIKQAHHAWYNELKEFLLSYGFVNSCANTSLFVYNAHGITTYFLVYVNDLLVIRNRGAFIQSFLRTLSMKFSIKDLGALYYFVGIKAFCKPIGLFLLQHKCIYDLLIQTNLFRAKEVSTLFVLSPLLTLNDGSTSTDVTQYRSVVETLQYLSLTRPNISHTFNKLAQFMHRPIDMHQSTIKHLL